MKTPLESDIVVTFFAEKDAQKTTKEYEYLLNEKQSRFDHFNEENNARDNFLWCIKARETKDNIQRNLRVLPFFSNI